MVTIKRAKELSRETIGRLPAQPFRHEYCFLSTDNAANNATNRLISRAECGILLVRAASFPSKRSETMETIIFEVVTKSVLALAAIIAFIVWDRAGRPYFTITRR